MDRKTTAQGIRTYAKNALSAYAGQVDKLRNKLDRNPNTVDAVIDFEAFIETRALANIYQELGFTVSSETGYSDDKVIDRIQDKRESLTRWLMQSKNQAPGLHAVQQHHAQEAAKRFLSDTSFVEQLDD